MSKIILPHHIVKLSKKWYWDVYRGKYIPAAGIEKYIKKRKAEKAQTKLELK